LFRDIDSYFSNGYLNSEGIKLLNKALEVIVEYCPSYSAKARKARKTMLLEDVEKLYSALLDECSEELLDRVDLLTLNSVANHDVTVYELG